MKLSWDKLVYHIRWRSVLPFLKSRAVVGRVSRLEKRDPSGVKCAVLIHSFDGYKRFHAPCIHLYHKHAGVTDDVWFATERITPGDLKGMRPLHTGEGTFVERLIVALEALQDEYTHVFYLQEDMWLDGPLDWKVIQDLAGEMARTGTHALKLGAGSLDSNDRASISRNEAIPMAEGLPEFLHYGSHGFPVSHHTCLFDLKFLKRTLTVARWAGCQRPIQHELFCTEWLAGAVRGRSSDDKPLQIGVWKDSPVVDYVHACDVGRITIEARRQLEQEGIPELYDESLPGEVFPATR